MRKLHKQQGIKSATKQPHMEATFVALEAQLRIISQPEEGDLNKKEGQTNNELAWGRNKENPEVNCQTLSILHNEPD